MTARTLWTSAAGVLLAVVGTLAAPAPSSDPAGPVAAAAVAPGPLAVASVDVPVTPDDGPHVVGEDGHDHAEYGTYGTRWTDTDLTYGFVNHTGDVSVAAQEAAVAAALGSWASVSRLTFTEVADCGLAFDHPSCTTPDLRISFVTGTHGGTYDPAFDGPGGTAAHAFYPPPNGSSAAGDIHLDDAERWTTSGNGLDLQSIVLHEAGHALGLTHAIPLQCPLSPGPNRPIMCGTIIGVDRTLAADDVNGVRALYGLPALSCGGRAVTVDLNEGQRPTKGADVILGTPGGDVINASAGADVVCGGGGHDRIDLGPGNDRALGGPGNDVLIGGSGIDRLEGGGGADRLVGGDHGDVLVGGGGRDTLDGGRAADRLYAGPHLDRCNGRGGRDAQKGCENRIGIELRLR